MQLQLTTWPEVEVCLEASCQPDLPSIVVR